MSRPRGLTLVEVLMALTIGALVAAAAHQLLASSTELARRVDTARLVQARTANARRFLIMAVANTSISGHDADTFAGSDSTLTLATWLPAASGALERMRLLLLVHAESLWAVTDVDTLELATGVASCRFDYLLSLGTQAPWEREWRSAVTAPVAVRVRIRRVGPIGLVDTLLLPVGPRG